jgi:hypothetical protein
MGRLLLKHDGILIQEWNPLGDSLPAEVIPTVWDSVRVARRFSDALQLLSKMPDRADVVLGASTYAVALLRVFLVMQFVQ